MSSIRRAQSKISIERDQWANLDKYQKDIRLTGRGEGRKTIMFGRGFTSPPTFNYSAVFDTEEAEIMPWYVVPPRGSDKTGPDYYGYGNDSQGGYGLIQDPGFENQGKWKFRSTSSPWSQIWSTRDMFAGGGASSPIKVWASANPPADTIWSLERWVPHSFAWTTGNRWVQTEDTRNRWSVTDEEHHDLGVGTKGSFCAKATIGPNGYTNWLIPYQEYFGWIETLYSPGNEWRTVVSAFEGLPDNVNASFGAGIYAKEVPPPYISGWYGMLHTKSTSDHEVEVHAVYANEGSDNPVGTPSTEFGFTFADYFDPYQSQYESTIPYYEVADIEFKASVQSGDWRRTDYDLPYHGSLSWPEALDCLNRKGLPTNPWWTFKYRINGTPGDVVYLDNVFITRRMRNSEIPIMTIGVAEWVLDDAGAYIGADLWFKVGEPLGDYCVGN